MWLAASTVGHNKTKVRKYYFHTWVRLYSQGCLETQDLSNSKFTVNYSMDGINSDTASVCTTVITTEYWLWCLLQCYFILWVVMATARGDIIQTSFCCYTSTRFSYFLDFQTYFPLYTWFCIHSFTHVETVEFVSMDTNEEVTQKQICCRKVKKKMKILNTLRQTTKLSEWFMNYEIRFQQKTNKKSFMCGCGWSNLHRLLMSDSWCFMSSKFAGSICSFVSSTLLLMFSSRRLSLYPRFSWTTAQQVSPRSKQQLGFLPLKQINK